MADSSGIEIVVRDCSRERIAAWLSAIAGPLGVPESIDEIDMLVYPSRLGLVEVATSEDGERSSSIWFKGANLPWASDVDCARAAMRALGRTVLCDPGEEHPGVHPSAPVLLEVSASGERLFGMGDRMLDLEADLRPGGSAAGIPIGTSVDEVLARTTPFSVEQRIGLRVLKYGKIWVFDVAGTVSQICVYAGYRGKIAEKIGIGSTVTEVEAAFGTVIETWDDVYTVPEMPGWCFDVEPGSPLFQEPGWPEARIQYICISRVS